MDFYKIEKVKTLDNLYIEATFKNGIKKIYDIKPLIAKLEVFKKLEKEELFKKVKVDTGGMGILWDEELDLASEEIWKNGIEV